MLTTDRRMGLLVETIEGLTIPLALDQAAVDSLSAAMRGDGTSSGSQH
jgi:hypothetical protein